MLDTGPAGNTMPPLPRARIATAPLADDNESPGSGAESPLLVISGATAARDDVSDRRNTLPNCGPTADTVPRQRSANVMRSVLPCLPPADDHGQAIKESLASGQEACAALPATQLDEVDANDGALLASPLLVAKASSTAGGFASAPATVAATHDTVEGGASVTPSFWQARGQSGLKGDSGAAAAALNVRTRRALTSSPQCIAATPTGDGRGLTIEPSPGCDDLAGRLLPGIAAAAGGHPHQQQVDLRQRSARCTDAPRVHAREQTDHEAEGGAAVDGPATADVIVREMGGAVGQSAGDSAFHSVAHMQRFSRLASDVLDQVQQAQARALQHDSSSARRGEYGARALHGTSGDLGQGPAAPTPAKAVARSPPMALASALDLFRFQPRQQPARGPHQADADAAVQGAALPPLRGDSSDAAAHGVVLARQGAAGPLRAPRHHPSGLQLQPHHPSSPATSPDSCGLSVSDPLVVIPDTVQGARVSQPMLRLLPQQAHVVTGAYVPDGGGNGDGWMGGTSFGAGGSRCCRAAPPGGLSSPLHSTSGGGSGLRPGSSGSRAIVAVHMGPHAGSGAAYSSAGMPPAVLSPPSAMLRRFAYHAVPAAKRLRL
jgi:hypothetical protein